MDRVPEPLKAPATNTAKFLSCKTRCVESSVTVIWRDVGGARISSCIDEVVIFVYAQSSVETTTSTAHFRSGKVIVVVGSVTSLSEMILAIVRARVSFDVEVMSRGVFAGFRGG